MNLGEGVADDAMVSLPPGEAIRLGAADGNFYCHTFFPNTFRQDSPDFHREMWNDLTGPARLIAFEVYRGSAKTTLCRAFASQRVAYGLSRTILWISASSNFAEQSLRWIKGQIERNRAWTSLYGLRQGSKWTENWIEIAHEGMGDPFTVNIVALGITGQIRGLNLEDYRPDLIIIDDPLDEENTATPEQREKLNNLIHGSVRRSLSPASENPGAKLVILATPHDNDDPIEQACRDKSFVSKKFGCFDELGHSRWESRYPTKELRAEKQAEFDAGRAVLWLREMEVNVVDSATTDFKREWLQFYEIVPESMVVMIGIDPVPPPKERELSTKDTDYEVISVVGAYESNIYLLDYAMSRGHEPEWTVAKFFELLDRWVPLRCRVEGVAYQRTLRWILEREMKERRRFIQINVTSDRRAKRHRILQSLSGIASQRRLFVKRSHIEFIQQFVSQPNLKHDDVLDATSMAVDELLGSGLAGANATVNDYTDRVRARDIAP